VVKVFAAVTTRYPSLPDPLLISVAVYLELIEKERKRLHELVESTAAELRQSNVGEKLRIETMVLDGSPKEVIVEEAEKWGADLILVGSHGYVQSRRLWRLTPPAP
jgi:nucleotide-binding universal stress UspA family protein